MKFLRLFLPVLLAGGPVASAHASFRLPRFDHIVVVIEENHSYSEILGPDSPAAFIRQLAANGASFTQSFAVMHPSEPNYLALFCGSTHGMRSDAVPPGVPFSSPNLASELAAQGLTFAGYSQSLPYAGFAGRSHSQVRGRNEYKRKHNPWVDWQSPHPGRARISPLRNLPFAHCFPTAPGDDFSLLPTVAFVIPDERYDMHDGTVAAGDRWLRRNLGAYARWARTHNSLLIITWDEDEGTDRNRIPTIFYGDHVRPGRYHERIDHYRVLRTIEDIYGLAHARPGDNPPISDVFQEK